MFAMAGPPTTSIKPSTPFARRISQPQPRLSLPLPRHAYLRASVQAGDGVNESFFGKDNGGAIEIKPAFNLTSPAFTSKESPTLPRPLSASDLSNSVAGSRLRVAYQGLPGAYSESAAAKAYPDCEAVPCELFETAFDDRLNMARDCRIVVAIASALYGIWRNRNAKTKGESTLSAAIIATIAIHQTPQVKTSTNQENWDPFLSPGLNNPLSPRGPLPLGWYSVNFDGAVDSSGCAGAGAVVRDHQGGIFAAVGCPVSSSSPIRAEMVVARLGVHLASELIGLHASIIIEGDSLITIQEICSARLGNHNDDIFISLIQQAASFIGYSTRHIYREANHLADFCAHEAMKGEFRWIRGMPLPSTFASYFGFGHPPDG